MSTRSHFHYPFVVTLVAILHAGFLSNLFPQLAAGKKAIESIFEPKNIIKLTDIRRAGAKDGKSPFNMAVPIKTKPAMPKEKQKISLEDLAGIPTTRPNVVGRPGQRPEVGPKKALDAIALKGGNQMRKFLNDSGTGADAMDMSGTDKSLNSSNVAIKLEVPEGVSPDELNDYELMFYGFQKRTATNYINSLFKNIDDFQKKNPHLNFPMTKDRQIMTGRLTYDEKGNIKQIKMIRWTHDDKLQNFFESVLKDMDVLHNPPQALWEKSGEFSIFFTLQLNG